MRQSSAERARIRRLRAKYRKQMVVVAIIFLIIGLILGYAMHPRIRTLMGKNDTPRVVEVMVTPTPEPYVEPNDISMEIEDHDNDDFDEDAGFDASLDDAREAQDDGFGDVGLPDDDVEFDDSAVTNADQAQPAEQQPVEQQPAEQQPAEQNGAEALAIAMETPTPEPTATPEPTPTPTPEPTPEPTTAVVPFGESYEFSTQIKQDGTARIAASDEFFETLNFTMSLKDYMLPSDFAEKWGSVYKLQGNEAGAGFELTLNNYTGTATIIPQNIIKIAFVSESGNTENLGFQLMDAEIAGNLDVTLQTNVPKTLWKRYTYSNAGEELKYLAVTTYNNGVAQTILFELKSNVAPTPDPLEQYTILTRGDKKDEVLDLQKRLIELGYLSGTADGKFGEKTQTAVREAQKAFGMEETGTATPEFQLKLFSDEAQEPEADSAETAEDAAAESDDAAEGVEDDNADEQN